MQRKKRETIISGPTGEATRAAQPPAACMTKIIVSYAPGFTVDTTLSQLRVTDASGVVCLSQLRGISLRATPALHVCGEG